MATGAHPCAGAECLQVSAVPIGAARLGCQAAGARLAAEGKSVTVITTAIPIVFSVYIEHGHVSCALNTH